MSDKRPVWGDVDGTAPEWELVEDADRDRRTARMWGVLFLVTATVALAGMVLGLYWALDSWPRTFAAFVALCAFGAWLDRASAR